MAGALIRVFWRLPRVYPTTSTILSGIVGLIGIVYGILLLTSRISISSYENPSSNIAGGVILLLLGLLISGLVTYAAYTTNYFQRWSRADGTYGHAFIRWLGPICIIAAILEFIIALWIITAVFAGMSKK
ncbi:MAG TPA: hypothetical protein VL485_28155 [Ktedonobacteraceae bacterium]|jgi:hypothetical protein|nr:hypothetical protein [Ktedonobacteraceae bacterium]